MSRDVRVLDTLEFFVSLFVSLLAVLPVLDALFVVFTVWFLQAWMHPTNDTIKPRIKRPVTP